MAAHSRIFKSNSNSKKGGKKPSNANSFDLDFFQERITALTGAFSALPLKNSRSAAYLVIKTLISEKENIVTLNSVSLYKNAVIRERLGIEVRLAEEATLSHLKNLIDENTRIIYLESLGLENFIIPDFQQIIAFANSARLLVVVDNTIGIANQIINPINLGAHFVIESFSNLLDTSNRYTSTIILEGRYDWSGGLFENFREKDFYLTSYWRAQTLDRKIATVLPESVVEWVKAPESLVERTKNLSRSSLQIAQWLKELSLNNQVEYPGFSHHASYSYAFKYLTGGYGNIISSSLSVNSRSFDVFLDNLIPRSFQLFNTLSINYEQKKVTIRLLDDNFQKQVAHFQQAFEHLQKYPGTVFFLYENLYDEHDVADFET